MVYSNKLILSILFNGQPQKELANGVVKLPFGSEYSLRLRNRNSVRAVVDIFIDGEKVSGNGYVIPANDKIDIKRHHDKDRAFKFVSLDSADAVDFGKNGPNHDKTKGVIEVRFYLEKVRPVYNPPLVQPIHHHWHTKEYHHYPNLNLSPTQWSSGHVDHTYRGGTTCDSFGGPSPLEGMQMNAGFTEISRGSYQMDDCKLSDQADCDMGEIKTSASPERKARHMMRSHCIKPCGMSSSAKSSDFSHINESQLKDGCTVEGEQTGQRFESVYLDYDRSQFVTLKVFLQGFEPVSDPNVVEETKVFDPVSKQRHNRKTPKRKLDLERENEELRQKLAELENAKLKAKLAELENAE